MVQAAVGVVLGDLTFLWDLFTVVRLLQLNQPSPHLHQRLRPQVNPAQSAIPPQPGWAGMRLYIRLLDTFAVSLLAMAGVAGLIRVITWVAQQVPS